MGKTRLIAEWKAASQSGPRQVDFRWVEGRCLSYGHRLANHLILSMLHSLIGVPTTSDEPETRAALCALLESFSKNPSAASQLPNLLELYPHLAQFLSLSLEEGEKEQIRNIEPQTFHAQVLAGIRSLLLAFSARQPLVLVLEDLHWADPSSVDFLTQLLPLATTSDILFCLVMRPERENPGWRLVTTARELLGDGLTEINLPALSEADSRKLVANLLEIEALPEQTRALILEKAEGNPFFVEEVIRMLIDRKAIVRQQGRWHTEKSISSTEIPDNLQGLLLARIDRLPEDVKQTLRVASVIGRQFPLKVLEMVLAREKQP